MKRYQLKLRHDNGKLTLLLWASSESAAIETAMNIEKCPRRSILSVKEVTPQS